MTKKLKDSTGTDETTTGAVTETPAADASSDGALLLAPAGALSVSWGGVTYQTMAGKVRVPHAAVGDLISHGYVEV